MKIEILSEAEDDLKKQDELVQVYAVLDCRGDPKKALQLLDELDARGL